MTTSGADVADGARPRSGRVRLRAMARDDLDQVARLELELFEVGPWSRETFAEELRSRGRRYVVAVAGAEVVGYGGVSVGIDSEVMTLGVAPGWRGAGIGARLLADLLAHARAGRSRRVFLEVRSSNGGAQRLYERAGFGRVGVREGYYEDGSDAVVMSLVLRGDSPPIGSAEGEQA